MLNAIKRSHKSIEDTLGSKQTYPTLRKKDDRLIEIK